MRAANEAYLAAHPELQILVSLFTKHALEAKPKDPMAFACKVRNKEKKHVGIRNRERIEPTVFLESSTGRQLSPFRSPSCHSLLCTKLPSLSIELLCVYEALISPLPFSL